MMSFLAFLLGLMSGTSKCMMVVIVKDYESNLFLSGTTLSGNEFVRTGFGSLLEKKIKQNSLDDFESQTKPTLVISWLSSLVA